MMFEGEEDAEVIDGQVTGRADATTPELHVYHRDPNTGPTLFPSAGLRQDQQQFVPPEVADKILQLATDQRSRAIALFVEVPFLAYIAFNSKVPGLVRLGAAALGVMRAVEVAQRQQELEQYLPELP